jgi:hypothetical protein
MKKILVIGFIAISFCLLSFNNDKTKSYLIGYMGKTEAGTVYVGAQVSSDHLPTSDELKKLFSKESKLTDCVILSVYEFRSKAEADRFFKTEE